MLTGPGMEWSLITYPLPSHCLSTRDTLLVVLMNPLGGPASLEGVVPTFTQGVILVAPVVTSQDTTFSHKEALRQIFNSKAAPGGGVEDLDREVAEGSSRGRGDPPPSSGKEARDPCIPPRGSLRWRQTGRA